MNRNDEEILSVRSLKIGYTSGKKRTPVLPELNASAHRGESIAVIGRNGVGKSTLLRTLTGLQPALDGEILIEGRNIAGFSRMELARKVGYISTEVVRVSNMTVYELVALGRFPYTNWIGRIDPESRKIISEAISKAGLSGFESRLISELSDGERQRSMIARVLAQDTDLLIMDEPTAFLDIGGRFEITELLYALSRNGKTVIFSTHDLNIALPSADKIWLLLKDSLIEGSPEEMIRNHSFDSLFDTSRHNFDSVMGNSFRIRRRE